MEEPGSKTLKRVFKGSDLVSKPLAGKLASGSFHVIMTFQQFNVQNVTFNVVQPALSFEDGIEQNTPNNNSVRYSYRAPWVPRCPSQPS